MRKIKKYQKNSKFFFAFYELFKIFCPSIPRQRLAAYLKLCKQHNCTYAGKGNLLGRMDSIRLELLNKSGMKIACKQL